MTRKHPNRTFNSTGMYRREVTLRQFIDETESGDAIVVCVSFICIFVTAILFMLGVDPDTIMVIVLAPITIAFIVFWIMPRMNMKVVE